MVVSPNEILEKVTAEEKRKIPSLEKEIDTIIESDFRLERNCVCYNVPKNITLRAIDIIIEMYEKAGWKVTYISDQRDGDYLHFVPAYCGEKLK